MKATLSALAIALALAGSAAEAQEVSGSYALPQPGLFVRSVRVGATDLAKTATTAAFYQAVFGMKEFMHVNSPGLLEVIMNFGATADEARANKATGVVVITSPIPLDAKAVSPLIMSVDDMDGIVARVTAHGGIVDHPPKSYDNGFTIAMVRDPSGNRIELVRQK